ncbi:hypothetical protein [Marinobacter nauticus]|uniref:hypothetical protein n=1 Tax=Marinobacter nauticus TaxID=2743 RepID=UPI001C993B45|nr:hypothetical protein [Marinobacter nauticus]MBY5962120.1 hypothetical protein [Marinobacter nauticus]
MTIPRLTDFTAMMHDIAASAKIATCLLVTSGFYLLSKRFEFYSWGELPQWVDGIAVLIFLYSAASIVWEAVPRIWNSLKSAYHKAARERAARNLNEIERHIVLTLSVDPAQAIYVGEIDRTTMDINELDIQNAVESLIEKGLISRRSNYIGPMIRLTTTGIKRAHALQEKVRMALGG